MPTSKRIDVSRSQFAEAFLYLKGEPYSLKEYPHMYDIFDSPAKEICLKFSRQTSKSTTLSAIAVTDCATIPFFQVLYVAPRVDQTRVFSNDRVAPLLEHSPFIKDNYINSTLVQNVFNKQFLNGSKIYLKYALLNADAIRGISADETFIDECQDLRAETIPVIQETMSRSLVKKTIYAGTPKRTKGTLADLWFRSSQNEYAIKCDACNYWNILGDSNIGLEGIICSKCGKSINIKNGEWVSTYSLIGKPTLAGYRICALHFAKAPWVDWKFDILEKRERSPKAIFNNEVLALEYDEGASPITRADIARCCDPSYEMSGVPTSIDSSYNSIIGIDYGPINSENSNTVCVVMQDRGDHFRITYMRKFVGNEADYSYIHREIPKLMQKWNGMQLAADYGMGESANAEIRSRIGYQKVIAFQHLNTQKEKIRWNAKIPAYTLNRNMVLNDFFDAIKKCKIKFPRWEDTERFIDDFLNMHIEYNEENNTMKYINIGPDDLVHAGTFAFLALNLMRTVH